MPLNLGPVKPHVQAAAEQIARQFGMSHIGGWRATGSVPGSDHPKGLALDVMTRDVSKGNAVAAWATKRPDVTYVIWNRRIYDRRNGKGWQRYSGPSPHTDHVHISFFPSGSNKVESSGGSNEESSAGLGQILESGAVTLFGGFAIAGVGVLLILAIIFYAWWRSK